MHLSYEFDLNNVDIFKIECPTILSCLFSFIWKPRQNNISRRIQHKLMTLMGTYLKKQNVKGRKYTYSIKTNDIALNKFKYDLDFQLFRVNNKTPEALISSIAYILRNKIEVILDVGSNIGLISAQISQFNPAVKIYSFEPQLKCAELSKFVYSTLGANATVYQVALGSETTSSVITNSVSTFSGYATLKNSDENIDVGTLVSIVRLDDHLSDYSISKIDLIKIDVEGFELEVLKGAVSTISKHNPIIIYEDFGNLKNSLHDTFEIAELLHSLNYALYIPFFLENVFDEPILSAYEPFNNRSQNMRVCLVPVETSDEFFKRDLFNVINVIALPKSSIQELMTVFTGSSST